jgi:serine/threonine protein kinase
MQISAAAGSNSMQIGDYKLTHRLGSGGMGTVFRAVDSSSRPVALKFIGSQTEINATVFGKLSPGESPALDPRYRMMLVREARLAMGLNHPNIVRVFEYNQHRGMLYIVMELLGGRSLDRAIPLQAAIHVTTKISLIRQLCAALEYAHSHNVIHRDIKPSNCRVLPDGMLKVLDFGIAARAKEGAGDLKLVGTFPYMAPELLNPRPQYSEKSDMWAAGVTLYQMLTGRLPFTGNSLPELRNNILQQDFPPLGDQLPNREVLAAILTRALAKNPRERYRSAAEFRYQLSFVGDAGPTANAAPGQTISADEDRWWATNVVQETTITNPLQASTQSQISLVSGEVKVRRGGHTVRLAEYNHWLSKFLPAWVLLSLSYALVEVAGRKFWERWDFSPFVFYTLLGYVGGLLIPLFIAGSIVLFVLAFSEKFAGTPRCRRCREIVQHTSRTTTFVYTEASWRHASSDCLAALQENLWDDAPRLLSIHGALAAPPEGERTDYPQLRLHLDMHSCGSCGDELAILTTEDRFETAWGTRPEYEGMCKSSGMPAIKRGFRKRLAGVLQTLYRTANSGVLPRAAGITLFCTLWLVVFYYPQLPVLVGIPGYRSVVTIETDPPGVEISIDNGRFVTPHTFSWTAGSDHNMEFELGIRKKGRLYAFHRLVPADTKFSVYGRVPYPGFEPFGQHGSSTIHAQASLDRFSRLTRSRERQTLSIIYSPVPQE